MVRATKCKAFLGPFLTQQSRSAVRAPERKPPLRAKGHLIESPPGTRKDSEHVCNLRKATSFSAATKGIPILYSNDGYVRFMIVRSAPSCSA